MPGWRVDLAPEHFLGEAEAEVHPDDEAPFPHGTPITFQASEPAAAIRNAAENAARHYPLPVFFEGIASTEPGGETNVVSEQFERRAFLDGAVHAEPWQGLAFGVFRDRHRGYNDPDLNFHDLTLPVRLPTVETVHGGIWSVRADIGDCPNLELVLPAREEAVENDFLKEMRNAARLAICHTPVYPREVCVRALELQASAVIAIHDHPSVDPEPSRADIDMTGRMRDALKTIDVTLLDHVVVTPTGSVKIPHMVGVLGGALAGQLVVFAQERRQFQGLEVMGQQHLRRIGHDAPPPNKLI